MMYTGSRLLIASAAVLALSHHLASSSAQTDLQTCIEALYTADINNDNRLNSDPEYIKFLNEVSGDKYESLAYESLPQTLQENFENYMGFGESIDITGSKPGSYPTSQQLRLLENFCEATMEVLEESSAELKAASDVSETTGVATNDLEPAYEEYLEYNTTSFGDNVLYITEGNSSLQTASGGITTLNENISIANNATYTLGENGTSTLTDEEAEGEPIKWDEDEETETAILSTEWPTQSLSPTITPLPSPSPSASPTISPAPTQGQHHDCKMIMQFSDIDGDGVMNELEYVWFLNDNWGNQFPGVAFGDLPQVLKDSFNSLANYTGQINISGGGEAEQDGILERICAETENSFLQVEKGDISDQQATMSTFKNCLAAIVVHDQNADTKIDEDEFTKLIFELSKEKLSQVGFDKLPNVVQETFITLTGTEDAIDLAGAKQGEDLTGPQEERLAEICMELTFAVDEASGELNEDGAQFGTGDTLTMLEYAECFMGMNTFDINKDLGLNQVEYTQVVNQLARNQFDGLTFPELPIVLQRNFFNLATNGDINIESSAPNDTPGSVQQKYLEKVCMETAASINIVMNAQSPTAVPFTSNPVEPTTIHSSFNIYSDVWISREELSMGTTRERLEEAYAGFVRKVFDESTTSGATARAPRRHLSEDQKPLLSLDRDSPTIYHIADLSCAGSETQETTCKTVFARYNITVVDGSDPQDVYDKYVKLTQRSIDSGILQTVLERIYPGSLISVIGSSEHLVYDESTFQSPNGSISTSTDKQDENSGGGMGKKKTLALIAVAVGCLAIGSIIGLVVVRYRRKLAEMKGEDSSFTDALFGMGKAPSDTESHGDNEEEGLCQIDEEGETTCSERNSAKNSIFRSRGSDHFSLDDDDASRDLGPMDVIEVCDGVVSAQNEFEARVGKHVQDFQPNQDNDGSFDISYNMSEVSSVPPLTRPNEAKNNDSSTCSNGGSASSKTEDLSFAFRRFALNGGKKKRDQASRADEHHDVV